MNQNMLSVLIILMFMVLFMVIWTVLKKASIFGTKSSIVVALCVAALCIISLLDVLPPSLGIHSAGSQNVKADLEKQERFQFILLPYLALMIAILGLLLILALARIWSLCSRFMLSSIMQKGKKSEAKKLFSGKITNRNQQIKKQKDK